MPAWPFVFYCLPGKIGTLGERPLLARSGRSTRLPREVVQRLDIKRGQQFHVTELAGGGFQFLPYDPDFEATLEIADEIMGEYRDTLATLAK